MRVRGFKWFKCFQVSRVLQVFVNGWLAVALTACAAQHTEDMRQKPSLETCADVSARGLPVLGDYITSKSESASESESMWHWLRATQTATTYTRVPAGAATMDAPPVVEEVVASCADHTFFVTEDGAQRFWRVDWQREANGLWVCHANVSADSVALALELNAAEAHNDTTGCHGDAWVVLEATE